MIIHYWRSSVSGELIEVSTTDDKDILLHQLVDGLYQISVYDGDGYIQQEIRKPLRDGKRMDSLPFVFDDRGEIKEVDDGR